MAEVAVLLSLFTAGLKLRLGLDASAGCCRSGSPSSRWWSPWPASPRPAWLLGLPLGAAVLLGAILAPTDPVLASDVQVANAGDRDRLRFALTGEAGLNDGTAFPFVMLGLGLLGLHELGAVRLALVRRRRGLGRRAAASASARCSARWSAGWCCTCGARTRRRSGSTTSWRSGLIALSYGAALLAARLRLPGGVRRRPRAAADRAARDRQPRRSDGQRGAPAPAASRRPPRPGSEHAAAVAPSAACAGLHGPGGLGLQRAARAHRRGRRGDPARHDAVGGRVAPRALVVRRRCCCW